MEIRKALISWDKTAPKVEKMSEAEKDMIAIFAQGIIARGKLERTAERRDRKKTG